MREVNFAIPLKNFAGKEVREIDGEGNTGEVIMLNKVVANTLDSSRPVGDAIRQRTVAFSIWSAEGAIQLEDADFEMVKQVLKQSGLPTSLRALADEAIASAVEVKKESK